MHSSCALSHVEVDMSTAEAQTDEGLMALLAQGEDYALAELVRRYQNDVFRFCLYYLKDIEGAKETVQETFLRVFSARERFDVARKFKPWMLCIARNLCLNELKRKKAVPMDSLEEYASASREASGHIVPWATDGPAQELMANERRRALLEFLAELPKEAREIVTLRYFQRLSAREIAELVDSTEGAVRTRLHRVLKQLRAKYAPLKDTL